MTRIQRLEGRSRKGSTLVNQHGNGIRQRRDRRRASTNLTKPRAPDYAPSWWDQTLHPGGAWAHWWHGAWPNGYIKARVRRARRAFMKPYGRRQDRRRAAQELRAR